MVVIPASRIEHRATAWALVETLKVLPDGQLHPAYPTQNCRLIPFVPLPDFNRVAGQCFMAVLARIVGVAAPHLDRDDIHWLAVMSAASLSIKANSVHMGASTGHTY